MHPLFYHSPPPYACTTCSVQIDTVKHTFSLYQPSGTPPRGKGSGGCPLQTYPSPTYFALPSCFVRVSNKTDGQEKKMGKKGGKKDYRLAFRAPRGPLSSIRNERAANHQSCYFSLSLSPSVPLSLQGPLSMKRAI